jgi:hypothetical protein
MAPCRPNSIAITLPMLLVAPVIAAAVPSSRPAIVQVKGAV